MQKNYLFTSDSVSKMFGEITSAGGAVCAHSLEISDRGADADRQFALNLIMRMKFLIEQECLRKNL